MSRKGIEIPLDRVEQEAAESTQKTAMSAITDETTLRVTSDDLDRRREKTDQLSLDDLSFEPESTGQSIVSDSPQSPVEEQEHTNRIVHRTPQSSVRNVRANQRAAILDEHSILEKTVRFRRAKQAARGHRRVEQPFAVGVIEEVGNAPVRDEKQVDARKTDEANGESISPRATVDASRQWEAGTPSDERNFIDSAVIPQSVLRSEVTQAIQHPLPHREQRRTLKFIVVAGTFFVLGIVAAVFFLKSREEAAQHELAEKQAHRRSVNRSVQEPSRAVVRTDKPSVANFSIPVAGRPANAHTVSANREPTNAKDDGRQGKTISPTALPRCPQGMAFVRSTQKEEGVCVDRYETPGKGHVPRRVTLVHARQDCRTRGMRLCTTKEWTFACGKTFPYSRDYRKEMCNTESDSTVVSGQKSRCRSAWGIYDLSGNVAEWVEEGVAMGGDHRSPREETRCDSLAVVGNLHGYRCCSDPEWEDW